MLMEQYAMNMHKIHALAAGVAMATSGASSVEGGNWLIFEQMLKYASATLLLGTTVSAPAWAAKKQR